MAFPSITTLFRALSYLSKRAQLAGASFVEGVVWGFPNAFGLFLEAYLGDPKFASQPHAASLLPLIGPSLLALFIAQACIPDLARDA